MAALSPPEPVHAADCRGWCTSPNARRSAARSSPGLFDGRAPGPDDLRDRIDGGDGRSGLARVHGHGSDLAGGGRARRGPVPPGQGDALAAAYRRGELTRAQYRALAEAVADSLRAEEQRAEGERGT
jgi:hypothetical protein